MSDNLDPCKKCSAHCCRSVAIEWEEPKDLIDWEHLRWLVAHKNVQVYKDHEGDWLVEFLTDCKNLDADNRCTIYDKRMKICRDHPADSCEKTGEEEYYTIMFRKPEEVEAYLKKNIL